MCGAWELAGEWFSCDPSAENWSFHPSEAAGHSPFAAFPYRHPSGETRSKPFPSLQHMQGAEGLLGLLYNSNEAGKGRHGGGKQGNRAGSRRPHLTQRAVPPEADHRRSAMLGSSVSKPEPLGCYFRGLIYAQAAPLRELLRHGFLTGT